MVEAAFFCVEHASLVHHFDSDDFGAVLLVNNTKIVDASSPMEDNDDDLVLQIRRLWLMISRMHRPTWSQLRIQTMKSYVHCLGGKMPGPSGRPSRILPNTQ